MLACPIFPSGVVLSLTQQYLPVLPGYVVRDIALSGWVCVTIVVVIGRFVLNKRSERVTYSNKDACLALELVL